MLVRSVREDHPLSSGQIDADGFGLPGLLIDAHFKVDDLKLKAAVSTGYARGRIDMPPADRKDGYD
jgi:hypothetical protein